jgi:hypothetical protein
VAFEVRPTRVGNRSSMPPIAAIGGLVVFVVIAVVLATTSPTSPADRVSPLPPPAAAVVPSPPTATAAPAPDLDIDLGTLPSVDTRVVRCHSIDFPACHLLAGVAVAAVEGATGADAPIVEQVDVSTSLLCNSDADCPRDLLARMNPFGSAIVEVAGRPTAAWVNVTRVLGPSTTVHAWIIRWAVFERASTGDAAGGIGLMGPRSRPFGR